MCVVFQINLCFGVFHMLQFTHFITLSEQATMYYILNEYLKAFWDFTDMNNTEQTFIHMFPGAYLRVSLGTM